MTHALWPRLALVAPLLALSAARAETPSVADGGWPTFGGDPGAAQYSPLDQITPENVGRLKVAWVYRTGDMQRHADEIGNSSFSDTPILAGGSIILCTPWDRVIALDPATGKERWAFDPKLNLVHKKPGPKYVCRGVAAWTDPAAAPGSACATRIILGTEDLRLIALDAATGGKCEGFGDHGTVQVQTEVPQLFPGEVEFNGPPAIVNGVVVLGSYIVEGQRTKAPSGKIRAFDARTGAAKWEWDPIPQSPADPAWASWLNDGAKDAGAANTWTDMSVDEARDLVFLAVGTPSAPNGVNRPGDNRYSDSTVALRGATGERVWDFQIIHHDIWDYDLSISPLLADLTVDGRAVPAAIQLTKMGLIFVFNRETGAPVFPVEERPVPKNEDPTVWQSPTEPFPVTRPSLFTEPLAPKDAWGFTFWDRDACRKQMEGYSARGLYDPSSRAGTIMWPMASGGSNLGMHAYDPQRKLLIANIIRIPGLFKRLDGGKLFGKMVEPESGMAGRFYAGPMLASPFGAPCSPPPWGQLVAIDVEHQKIVWTSTLGTIEKLAPVPIPLRLGTPNRGGPIATGGGLIFVAATMDDKIRAFDTATGEELWHDRLPAGGQATPMTYRSGGKQYVVIAAGGHAWMHTTLGDYVVAYALDN